MKKNTGYLLILTFFIVLSACTSSATPAVVVQTEQVEVPTNTTAPTATLTELPTSTPTLTLTPTEVPTSTSTLVPTEVVNFDSVKIIGADDLGGYASIIFEFPAISKVYQVTINGSEYVCQIPEGVTDRLFCTGNMLRLDEEADVMFYLSDDYQDEVYASKIYVPKPYATPLPLGDPNTWCPLRGTNVTCETEHRIEDGEECWVKSCFDACGYYYSYHDCKYPPNNNFLSP